MRIWTFGGAALLALAWGSSAPAQERLHFEEMGDARLWDTTLQIPNRDRQDLRVTFLGGTSGASWPMTSPGPTTLVTPFLGFGLGASSAPTRFLQLYSELLAPFDESSPVALGGKTRLTDYEGQHRARASWGFGEVNGDRETGLDVEAEGKMSHATAVTTSYLRRDLPMLPFWDGEATARLWPRIGTGHDEAYVAPVSFTARRVAFGEGGLGGYTLERASAGVGIRPFDRGASHGWFEIVGLSWEKARFDGASAARDVPRLSGVQRVDVRALHVDGVYFAPESDMKLELSTHVGGAFVWDPTSGQQASTLTASTLMGMRILADEEKRDSVGFGVAGARRAGYVADATALTRSWRIEAYGDVSLDDERTGGSIRFATEQLGAIRAGAADEIDLGWKTALATEIFFAPAPGMKVGAFHVATDRCPPLALVAEGAYCQELGAFLRVEEHVTFAPEQGASPVTTE